MGPPVSRGKFAELTPDIMRLKSGGAPKPLDIVEVPLEKPVPYMYQSENCLVDESRRWKNIGVLPMDTLPRICDTVDTLWVNGHSSALGLNDRIPVEIAERTVKTSLLLIRPDYLTITVADHPGGKRRIHAHFAYRGMTYRLIITDPAFEAEFSEKKSGQYPICGCHVFLCISLGEPYEGFVYKLVASIITAL